MNIFYNTTRFFNILFLLFGFAFAQAQDLVVTPTAVAEDDDQGGQFAALAGAYDVTTVVIDEKTYALVASAIDHGVQIINITDPEHPTATAVAQDAQDGEEGFTALKGAYAVTTEVIGGKTYALVTGFTDKGVQIMDISNPEKPTATAVAQDDSQEGGQFTALDGARAITTVEIGGSIYALVASVTDNGVQIMDISNPEKPIATAAAVTDEEDDEEDGFTALKGAHAVTTVKIGESTYALVTGNGADGVQIMDITNPAIPTATTAVTDGGEFTALADASGITTVEIDSKTYALVTGSEGVQIMEISASQLSIGALFFTSLTLYPNPVTSHLHIDNPQSFELSYTVYDLTGKALSTHHITGQSHSIDVSALAKGVYLLEASHNNNTTAMQFVKE